MEKQCSECGEPILLDGNRIYAFSLRKFCSTDCYHKNCVGKKVNRVNKKKAFADRVCQACGETFVVASNNARQSARRACSKQCQIVLSVRWNQENTKGKSIYTPEEFRQKKLEWGRKSYRKNIATRLFYYRQLAAIRRGIKGRFTNDEWNGVLLRQQNKCNICGLVMDKPTIDHIIPIARWGLWRETHDVNYECNDIQNIQALCGGCNSRKRDRL